jgi:hypothetical protein
MVAVSTQSVDSSLPFRKQSGASLGQMFVHIPLLHAVAEGFIAKVLRAGILLSTRIMSESEIENSFEQMQAEDSDIVDASSTCRKGLRTRRKEGCTQECRNRL